MSIYRDTLGDGCTWCGSPDHCERACKHGDSDTPIGDIVHWQCPCGWWCRKDATTCPSCLTLREGEPHESQHDVDQYTMERG